MAFKKFTASEDILKPDPRYNSKLVSKFINCLMWQGKKTVAQRVVYGAMDQISKKVKDVPVLELFETAVNNIKPYVEVRSRRVGGANYQVPMQVNKRRQQSLAFRWLPAGRWPTGSPMNLWPHSKRKARRWRRVKTRTAWPTPTRPLRTSPGKRVLGFGVVIHDRRQGPARESREISSGGGA